MDAVPFYPYVFKEILSKDEVVCRRLMRLCISLLEPVLTSSQYGYQGYYAGKDNEGTREGYVMFWSLKTFC